MRLKSFHGATLTEAMRTVRDALGENAIIVATREDENGGVRVTAAIDEITSSPAPKSYAAPQPLGDGTDAIEAIAEALTRHQVPQAVAEKLLATATQFASDDALLALGAAIDTHIKFQPIDENKPVLLVGPPGAGKTLTTAKFATKFMLAKKSPTVVSTDLERAGGMEQLAAFTRLLKLNLVEIEDWHALRDVLTMQKGHPVFIDTAGRNIFDANEREATREFITAVGDATLVLPAGLDAAEAVDMALDFRSIGAQRLLITRLDSVKRLGSVLRIAIDGRLPLANYSASANVTEPPHVLNPVVLARFMLSKPGALRQVETPPKDVPKSAYGAAL